MKRLVQQLTRLQNDYVSLEGRYEQVTAELSQVQSEKENLSEQLLMTKEVPLIYKVGGYSYQECS